MVAVHPPSCCLSILVRLERIAWDLGSFCLAQTTLLSVQSIFVKLDELYARFVPRCVMHGCLESRRCQPREVCAGLPATLAARTEPNRLTPACRPSRRLNYGPPTRFGSEKLHDRAHAARTATSGLDVGSETVRAGSSGGGRHETPTQVQHPQADTAYPASWYDASGRLLIRNLNYEQLEQWVVQSLGEKPARARQLWRALYHHWPLLQDLDQSPAGAMPFSARFKQRFSECGSLESGIEVERAFPATPDGTRKLLLRLTSGPASGAQVLLILWDVYLLVFIKD